MTNGRKISQDFLSDSTWCGDKQVMNSNDHELLQRYVRDGSQAAFAELVRRHLDLVYSAARRQVRSSALAEEVSQSVFVDLSRNAANLKPGTPLVAWLHLVTRRTAIDAIRQESRRHAREQIALEIATMKPNPSVWIEMEPVLDEALEKLNEPDRTAVLLRFFENKSLREVGVALGTSEDAAQKRVTRALDQLRTVFAQRGIAVGATGLVTALSAHAIQTAPTALGATISTSLASLGVTTLQIATLETTKTIAMTTLKKTALAAVFVFAAGIGLYEANAISLKRTELDRLRQNSESQLAELRALRGENAAATRRLANVEAQIDSRLTAATVPAAGSDAALAAQIKTWLANIDRLKQLLAQQPALSIPELQFLAEQDWFEAASDANLDSDEGIRRSFAALRQKAGNLVAPHLSKALHDYARTHNQVLPENPLELVPYFDSPFATAILQRYTFTSADMPGELSQVLAVKIPVDVEYDAFWEIGVRGFSNTLALGRDIQNAQKQYAKSNNGQRASDAAMLRPYLQWPVSEAAVQKYLQPNVTP